MEDSDQEKTEDPTSKKIEDAREKGQVPFSREFTSFLFFMTLAINILFLAPEYSKKAVLSLSKYIANVDDFVVDEKSVVAILTDVSIQFIVLIGVPIAILFVMAIFSSGIQNSIVVSSESITPKMEKISVMAGFKRLFSMRSVVEFLKGLLKISMVGFAGYLIVKNDVNKILLSPDFTIQDTIKIISVLSFKIALAAAFIMLILSMFDILYQRFEFMKNLRMTRQELKEEYKQTEGSPEIKAKLKRIRQERARRRMMAAVPQADVVIRNPTHYAVALAYNEQQMDAPKVVAMGQDSLALKIIEIAEENKVQVITNRALAKALYETADIDQEIPLQHYKAVAEVIGYVYKLKGKNIEKKAS
jgi:flagellar biosynthetic protein FlhB